MQSDFPPRGSRFNDFSGPGPGGFMGPGGPNQGSTGLLGPPPIYQGPGPGQQFDPRFGPPNQGQMGPPPLMGPPSMGPMQGVPMGGPPRFMGPGMPPGPPPGVPSIDPSKEIWVETTSDQGKVYYYHAKTRQSIWKMPTDDNVQIIKQTEANALAAATAAGLVPPMLTMGPGLNRPQMQSGPGQNIQDRDNRIYHASEQGPRTKDEQDMMENHNMDGVPNNGPPEEQNQNPPPLMGIAPMGPRMGIVPLMRPPGPAGMPGPGFPGLPFAAPMPFLGGPMMIPGGTVWRAHNAPDGRMYYYNITTMETQWNKPKELEEMDEAAKKAEDAQKMEEDNVVLGEADSAKHVRFGEGDAGKRQSTMSVSMPLTEEEKEQQKQRPVATEPVPGTPWCTVWTGDEKVFYYNPTTKMSMWDRPDELRGRTDLDKILGDPPHKRKMEDEPESEQPVTKSSEPVEAEEITEDDANIPAKKKKTKKSTEEAHQPGKVAVPYVPLDERIQHFKDMLYERKVSAFSTWDKELHKIVFDPRYTMLNPKERKQVFESYVKTRADEERKEKKALLLKVKEEFKQLLEEAKVHNRMSFSEFAGKYGKEPRFKAVDKMKERENLYNEYLKEAKQKKTTEAKEKTAKTKSDFIALLDEKKASKYSRWSRVHEKIHSDSRYSAVESATQREEMWKEYCEQKKKSEPEDDDDEDAEKRRRMEESMKARTEQVEREKAERSKEIDTERQRHKQDEAIQHFKALLADMVRSTDQSWSETRRRLRKEPRWDLASLLTKEEKEKYFDEHIETLNKRKRFTFRKLLEETTQIVLTSTWKEVKKLLKDDPRYTKFSSSDRKREREFEEVMKDKKNVAKIEFRELLRETKLISHKSKEMTKSNSQHMKEVIATLENDKRYLVMNCMTRERDDLIYYYMDDLHRKGPPPPPTATEPSRRGDRK